MNSIYFTSVCLLFMVVCGCKSTDYLSKSQAQPLFTESSDSWVTSGDASWSFENGMLIGDGADGYITSTEVYGDFILSAEFYPDKTVNSGIFIRCPKDEVSATNCYEINI